MRFRLLLLAVLLGTCFAAPVASAQDHTEMMYDQSFAVAQGDGLFIEVGDADLEIVTEDRDEVRIEIEMRVYQMDLDRARDYYEHQRFAVSKDGAEVKVKSNERGNWQGWKRHRRGGVSVLIRAHIPTDFDVELHTSDGDIFLGDLNGWADVRSSDGDVNVGQIHGDRITLRSSDGDIRVDDLTAPRVEVKTSDGDIDLRAVEAETITVETSDGDVRAGKMRGDLRVRSSDGDLRLGSLRGGRIDLRTSDGTVSADEAVADKIEVHTADGDIELDRVDGALRATAGGDIRVGLAGAAPVYLRSGDGDVTIGLPRTLAADLRFDAERIRLSSEIRFDGDLDDEHVEGRINGGGPLIDARANDGTIALRVR